jgi:hypothetical protein
MRFVADDMVAWPEAGGRSISFVVKGTPVVQKRTVMAWKGRVRPHLLDPSMNAKRPFAQAVRIGMAAIGLSQEIYFTETTFFFKLWLFAARSSSYSQGPRRIW